MIRRAIGVVWLTFVWVALTGSASPPNVIGGAAVALALLSFFRPADAADARSAFRLWHAARFFIFFNLRFVHANLQVAMAVIQPDRVRHRRAVIAVPAAGVSEVTTTLLANAVTLTPGTFILEVRRDPTVLYVHVLQLSSVRAARLEILDMERRIVQAFGPPGAIERVDAIIAQVEAEPDAPGEE